ncbi:MAG TPA: hypothetical protein VN132_15410 [Bdellovibrio sp.]|nr:hypothetical protein [Bdellovibrio sp.]
MLRIGPMEKGIGVRSVILGLPDRDVSACRDQIMVDELYVSVEVNTWMQNEFRALLNFAMRLVKAAIALILLKIQCFRIHWIFCLALFFYDEKGHKTLYVLVNDSEG